MRKVLAALIFLVGSMIVLGAGAEPATRQRPWSGGSAPAEHR